MKLKTFQ